MIKKIQNEILEIIGVSLLLLSSFYFYKFSVFAVPKFNYLIYELLKVFLGLLFLNGIAYQFFKIKYKNFFLFIFLTYLLIFFLKLLFNLSGDISLHYFLKIFYTNIFNVKLQGSIPLFLKILSYITPFIIIFIFLFFFRKKLSKIKHFMVIFGYVVSTILIWDLVKIFDRQFSYSIDQNKIINHVNLNKKVLWLLFDGLDPEYINDTLNDKKLFINLNDLKDRGVFHENMYPPANLTLYSMPAQLMGINIKSMVPKHDALIFESTDGKKIPFNFDNSIFNKIYNLGLKVSLTSTVLEYCTSYLISTKWNLCVDNNSKNIPNTIFKESINFYFSLFYKFRPILKELGLKKNLKINQKNHDLSMIELIQTDYKNLDIDKINKIDFKNTFSPDHYDLINIDKIVKELKLTNFMFSHIYNPHLYPDSTNHIFDKLKLKINGIDPYKLKYLYTDLFIKKLIMEINKNNIEDLLIIISSDHWNRDQSAEKKISRKLPEVAFFVAKIIDDNNNYLLRDPSNSITIPFLINKYFVNEINTNNDIFNFFRSNKIEPNTLYIER